MKENPVGLGGRLEARVGDICELKAGGIVNAANSSLQGGGGVDGAIHRAGGPLILEECRRIRRELYPGGLPPGEAAATTAGNLPCGCVIHTVGPVWRGGNAGEREILAAAYRHCLDLAEERKLSSLAFPAISTGVYGYPPEKAAGVVLEVMREELPRRDFPEKVILVFFSPGGLEDFLAGAGGSLG